MAGFETKDELLVDTLKVIKKHGVYRHKVGVQRCGCFEMPKPVILTLNNPLARFTTLKARKANVALSAAESVWVLSGMNDLNELPGHFSKSVFTFSDDGKTYRAGYGPRIRFFDTTKTQYSIGHSERAVKIEQGVGYVDQLKYVIECLRKDPFTRQAVITIPDPNKDAFDKNGELLSTKDTPCTRSIHFMCDVNGNLDCTVHMRSNDILWGADCVNIPEFTFMQQIVAQICGLPLGKYYHIANNLHFYEDSEEMVSNICKELPTVIDMSGFLYKQIPITLRDLDIALRIMFEYESSLQHDHNYERQNPFVGQDSLEVFSDYAEIFRCWYAKKEGYRIHSESCFIHPQLQYIFREEGTDL